MHPILFRVGDVTVYSFGLLLALGIIIGGVVVALLARRYKLPTKTLFDDLLFVLFSSVIVSRIIYALVYPAYFKAPDGNFWQIFALWQGGLVYYGAILGGVIGAWYVYKNESANFYRWLDLMLFGLLVGVVFGQTGCFLGGCADGIYIKGGLSVGNRFPVQLFEAGWALIILLIGLTLYLKNAKWRVFGRVFMFGGWLLFAGRFLLDFWRESALRWQGISYLLIADLIILIIITFWILKTAVKHRHAHI